ncbi:hypothetical protein D8R48_17895 [Salmonella enterica subsp. enterica serovar Newport]|nr:hypothetical protein [Salmonella enterica subsp. enterica serovar Newport]EEH9026702.1 hypothetical protein [Salmonella enterica subsp. enterica serovar Newport]
MAVPKSNLSEFMVHLISYIDDGETLSEFDYHSSMRYASTISDISVSLTLKALASGAANKIDDAIAFFEEAVSFGDEMAARNYLTFLQRKCRYNLYLEVTSRVAKKINSFELSLRARNAAYSIGDAELSLFFARKAASFIVDDSSVRSFMADSEQKNRHLEEFMTMSGLTQDNVTSMVLLASKIAEKYNIPFTGTSYYMGGDREDHAIIMNVYCKEPVSFAEMDIELACSVAMSESFLHYRGTAWFNAPGIDEETY